MTSSPPRPRNGVIGAFPKYKSDSDKFKHYSKLFLSKAIKIGIDKAIYSEAKAFVEKHNQDWKGLTPFHLVEALIEMWSYASFRTTGCQKLSAENIALKVLETEDLAIAPSKDKHRLNLMKETHQAIMAISNCAKAILAKSDPTHVFCLEIAANAEDTRMHGVLLKMALDVFEQIENKPFLNYFIAQKRNKKAFIGIKM